ncbi:hypothetical protein [Hyphomicrobium sp. DMF-1]|uniref:hypothetical protein n=1 Tax=Hyphomicrobium sp. DMF-1 TaxID=3019544 RepID=UPI0022EBDCA2|nr:hypothetical protein [Hyphomicrobium sp. DMF-1]WBT37792.1 hypothetical protein PE058_19355 [Hyphomicrobium sp. DMF-1]
MNIDPKSLARQRLAFPHQTGCFPKPDSLACGSQIHGRIRAVRRGVAMNMAGMARTPALEQVAGVRRNLSVNDLPADAQAEKQLRAVGTGRSPLQQ